MDSAKWKAEPSTSKHDEALPRKRAHTQIFQTSYTTQWPSVIPVSNKLSCYAHCIICDKDFRLVNSVETTFADMLSQINTRLTGRAGKKISPSQNSLLLHDIFRFREFIAK